MANSAFETLDKNGDGQLAEDELMTAPGLKYASQLCDTDADKQLSKEELKKRLQEYKDSKLGIASFSFSVLHRGRPLRGAKVRLVPEPFIGAVIEPAEGTVDSLGRVLPAMASRPTDYGAVRVGMYRVEVTSDAVKIPPKYNTETTLGLEVLPFTNPQGPPVFDVGKN